MQNMEKHMAYDQSEWIVVPFSQQYISNAGFFKGEFFIWIQILLKCMPKKSLLVQIKCWTSSEAISEPVMNKFTDSQCIAGPEWVNFTTMSFLWPYDIRCHGS